jgi:hypothetical protein
MRKVFIYTGNHYHSVGIQDIVLMIRNGARDAGIDASVSEQMIPGQINIVIEHFLDEAQINHMRESRAPGTSNVIVCTELISPAGFNRDLQAGDGHYDDAGYWRKRHAGFLSAARYADMLWVLAESVVGDYSAALPSLPIGVLPHGWVSRLPHVEHRPEGEKDIDFFFSGTLTPFRRAILTSLQSSHTVCYCPQGGPDYLRLDLMARSRVCLSLPLSQQNKLPSLSRIHYHLQNRNFVLQLAHQGRCALDPYVLHAPAEDFIEWARASLELTNRREVAEGTHDRFRSEMPLARWIGPLLAELNATISTPAWPLQPRADHTRLERGIQ